MKCVRVACDEVIDQFLKSNNIIENRVMSFMERAALRSECKSLTRFLRSVDIMMIDFLWTMVFQALDNLVTKVECSSDSELKTLDPRIEENSDMNISKIILKREKKNWKAPLFRVVADFKIDVIVYEKNEENEKNDEHGKNDSMTINPSIEEIYQTMEKVIIDTVDVVGSYQTIFSSPEMQIYVSPDGIDEEIEKYEKTDLTVNIRKNVLFITAKNGIHGYLRDAYYAVKKYTKTFESYRKLFLQNLHDSRDISKLFVTGEVELFTETIAGYKAQINGFKEIPRYADIGAIFVDSDEMRARLIPSPLVCLQAIKTWLPELAQERAQELYDTIGAMNPIISSEPATVEAYVNKKKVKDSAVEGADRFRDQQAYVRSLVNLLDDNQWTVPDNVKVFSSF